MRFRVHLIAACAVMLLGIWLSSGTMYPYASTWEFPIVSKPCGYLFNIDHPAYQAAFDMLDGAPRARWEWSVVLRRILYPLVAFPFMKAAGFLVGGFIASALINLAALIALTVFLYKRWGERAAVVGAWLLAVHPGVTYWGALPYATAAIVPASLALFMLLVRLDERPELKSVALTCLGMSVLFTAYDLLPYFAGAAVILLIRRRRWAALPIAAVCFVSAPLIVSVVLAKLAHVPWANANTRYYGGMVSAYLHPSSAAAWLHELARFPLVLLQVFLFSNMVFLPALFVMVLLIARQRLTPVEGALLACVGVLVAFNNLAPPHPDMDDMRGDAIARIYQPAIAALIVYCARVAGAAKELERPRAIVVSTLAGVVLLANLSVAFGPIAHVPWAGAIYQRFYRHSFPDTMDRNLALHGRRPLGFCKR